MNDCTMHTIDCLDWASMEQLSVYADMEAYGDKAAAASNQFYYKSKAMAEFVKIKERSLVF